MADQANTAYRIGPRLENQAPSSPGPTQVGLAISFGRVPRAWCRRHTSQGLTASMLDSGMERSDTSINRHHGFTLLVEFILDGDAGRYLTIRSDTGGIP